MVRKLDRELAPAGGRDRLAMDAERRVDLGVRFPEQIEGVRLSIMQRRFVEEYSLHGNGQLAARRAGYRIDSKGKKVAQIFAHSNVQRALMHLRFARGERYRISEDAVLGMYLETWRASMEDKQFSAACRALDGISKLQGYLDGLRHVPDRPKAGKVITAMHRRGSSEFYDYGDKDLAVLAAPVLEKVGRGVAVSPGEVMAAMKGDVDEGEVS